MGVSAQETNIIKVNETKNADGSRPFHFLTCGDSYEFDAINIKQNPPFEVKFETTTQSNFKLVLVMRIPNPDDSVGGMVDSLLDSTIYRQSLPIGIKSFYYHITHNGKEDQDYEIRFYQSTTDIPNVGWEWSEIPNLKITLKDKSDEIYENTVTFILPTIKNRVNFGYKHLVSLKSAKSELEFDVFLKRNFHNGKSDSILVKTLTGQREYQFNNIIDKNLQDLQYIAYFNKVQLGKSEVIPLSLEGIEDIYEKSLKVDSLLEVTPIVLHDTVTITLRDTILETVVVRDSIYVNEVTLVYVDYKTSYVDLEALQDNGIDHNFKYKDGNITWSYPIEYYDKEVKDFAIFNSRGEWLQTKKGETLLGQDKKNCIMFYERDIEFVNGVYYIAIRYKDNLFRVGKIAIVK